MHKRVATMLIGAALMGGGLAAAQAGADEVTVTLHEVSAEGVGKAVGRITLQDGDYGLLLLPDLQGLSPGPYAVHVHEHPDCGPAQQHGHMVPAGAAGGHYDPHGRGEHAGPYRDGHLGDLPVLIAEADGRVAIPALAPRPKLAELRGRALMIHHGPDRYEHHDAHHHGMGGARMYCGIIDPS